MAKPVHELIFEKSGELENVGRMIKEGSTPEHRKIIKESLEDIKGAIQDVLDEMEVNIY